ncbi:phospholipase D-like domain-containing protein, partial [Candidatus Albibeggiatoa sp. nov. NOAA]|uniref:phospholipase D-like domain-containing protein n=1 Tax=Candidatus Albibeggiatoa sp. nov. NOAA TaxID=3162724 RepID=UPI003304BFAF|nr:phospholipase D-like domain-containing protein [Thiotrichaceae bacterium]
ALLSALKIAAARNVDIRIIVPEESDHWFVQNASRSFYGTLLEDGVRIFERKGRFNHSKAMLVDNEWSFMGSSNCDGRSFRLNYELDFICEQGSFIDEVHNQFLRELSKSTEISLVDYNKRGIIREFKENLASLFTPVL